MTTTVWRRGKEETDEKILEAVPERNSISGRGSDVEVGFVMEEEDGAVVEEEEIIDPNEGIARRALFSETLRFADRILSVDNSIPEIASKCGERVIAKSPEPQ